MLLNVIDFFINLWYTYNEKNLKGVIIMKKTIVILLLIMMLLTSVSCNFGVGDVTTEDPAVGSDNTTDGIEPDNSTGEGETSSTVTEAPPVTGGEVTEPPVVDTDPPATDLEAVLAAFVNEAYATSGAGGMDALDTKYFALVSGWNEVSEKGSNAIKKVYADMVNDSLTEQQAKNILKSFALISGARALANEYSGYVDLIAKSRIAYASAVSYVQKGRFDFAALELTKLQKADTAYVNKAKALISSNKANMDKGVSDKVTEFMVRYQIEDGKNFLSAYGTLYGVEGIVTSELGRLEDYRAYQQENLQNFNLYTGDSYGSTGYENIYTHCLIAFPEITFATASSAKRLDGDCLTPDEFRYLIQSLYEKDYVIVDINATYNKEEDKVNTVIQIPVGKKPLFLTFDDVTYDHRKSDFGMVDKLILDEYGYVCTYKKFNDGREVISYDNEIFPILDAFIREHPDFTFHGARGVLCLTGFDGILGYRTQSRESEGGYGLDSTTNRASEIEAVKPVIAALKAEGWTFGSHSYSHYWMSNCTAKTFQMEFDYWLEEVGSLVGETQVFVWPFGDHGGGSLRKGANHKYAFDSGFKIFLGCGVGRYIANETDGLGIFLDRKDMTGNALRYIDQQYTSFVKGHLYLIDPEKMWDKYRLPYRYSW